MRFFITLFLLLFTSCTSVPFVLGPQKKMLPLSPREDEVSFLREILVSSVPKNCKKGSSQDYFIHAGNQVKSIILWNLTNGFDFKPDLSVSYLVEKETPQKNYMRVTNLNCERSEQIVNRCQIVGKISGIYKPTAFGDRAPEDLFRQFKKAAYKIGANAFDEIEAEGEKSSWDHSQKYNANAYRCPQ